MAKEVAVTLAVTEVADTFEDRFSMPARILLASKVTLENRSTTCPGARPLVSWLVFHVGAGKLVVRATLPSIRLPRFVTTTW